MFYINSRYHWINNQIVDLRELASLLPSQKSCGESNLIVISGALWLTGVKVPGGCSQRALKSGDWLIEAGEQIPHWVLEKRKGVVASALGWLIIEATTCSVSEEIHPPQITGRDERTGDSPIIQLPG